MQARCQVSNGKDVHSNGAEGFSFGSVAIFIGCYFPFSSAALLLLSSLYCAISLSRS